MYAVWLLQKYHGKLSYTGGYPNINPKAQISISKGVLIMGMSSSVWRGTLLAVSGGRMEIGKGVLFNNNCNVVCKDTIIIGENSIFGPNVCIFDHNHRFDMQGVKDEYKMAPVTIGRNCWIGAGTTILKGTIIGDGCVIGAGSVVQGVIPGHSVVTSGRELTIVPVRK